MGFYDPHMTHIDPHIFQKFKISKENPKKNIFSKNQKSQKSQKKNFQKIKIKKIFFQKIKILKQKM